MRSLLRRLCGPSWPAAQPASASSVRGRLRALPAALAWTLLASAAHAAPQARPAQPPASAPARAASASAIPPAQSSQASPATSVRPAAASAPAAPAPRSTAPAHAAATPTAAAFCAQAVKRLPKVSMSLCAPAQLVDSGARSVQGVPLWQRDIVAPRPKRRVLVIGAIHGDELTSASLAFHWMALARQTPSDVHWRFVPVLNPDGTFRDKPTRTNANGVDLNRNFPTPDWDQQAPAYWAKRTARDPRRYPGPKALSEPESRWLMAEMERWKPDLIVAIHAPYGVLDFDGPAVPPQRLGRLYLDQVGIFPGSLGNWGGVHKKVPVVTIELNHALRTPQPAEMRQMWLDLLRWIGERLGAS